MNSRRDFLQTISAGLAITAASGVSNAQTAAPFTLPPLPYAADALEPHIDALTMTIHHDKHHAAYVANLNNAVKGQPSLAGKSLEEMLGNLNAVPEAVRTAVRNNGGGHANHSLFWTVMKKNGGGQPKGELLAAIEKKFGSFDQFKAALNDAGLKQFGSGWAWLSVDRNKQLALTATPNQDNPWMNGHSPLVGVDVWEHAYYLRYQNRRADYLAAWWNTLDWDAISGRYAAAMKA
ncbi:MAG: superoxide dismutase [Bryobacterales bacterium]|nr:superoxide dismutase [Bryobacterales bacterium]